MTRALVLAVAAFLSLATAQKRPAVTNPTPAPSPRPQVPAAWDGQYWCEHLQGQGSGATLCFPLRERCEQDRAAALADGVQASECRATDAATIACFQIGGDPNPSFTMCAASVEDCELWRSIDLEKNKTPSPACALASPR